MEFFYAFLPSVEGLLSNGALVWGLLWTGVVAAIGIASPRAALLLATFGLTYLARWAWGRMQLMWGENWARIDASFNYLGTDANGNAKLLIFPWIEDGKIQEWFKFNPYLEMRVRKYATWATVDEPVVTFDDPIMPRNDWWITIKVGRLMGWLRGTNAAGADGLKPIRTQQVNMYKETYGTLIKLVTKPFRPMALAQALMGDDTVIHMVVALTWETYTPDKSRHWRVYLMLEEHLRRLEHLQLPEDELEHPHFSRLRTMRIIARQFVADQADPSSPNKFGVARIPVPRALLTSPERLGAYLAGNLTGMAMPPPLQPAMPHHQGRRIQPRT